MIPAVIAAVSAVLPAVSGGGTPQMPNLNPTSFNEALAKADEDDEDLTEDEKKEKEL
jgi:hypothetical protein